MLNVVLIAIMLLVVALLICATDSKAVAVIGILFMSIFAFRKLNATPLQVVIASIIDVIGIIMYRLRTEVS